MRWKWRGFFFLIVFEKVDGIEEKKVCYGLFDFYWKIFLVNFLGYVLGCLMFIEIFFLGWILGCFGGWENVFEYVLDVMLFVG